MPRCELTGKGPKAVNLVSHSKLKTKSVKQPNIQKKHIFSQSLKELICLRMATSTIRNMEHLGGFDQFILNQNDEVLSRRALSIKKRICRKIKGKPKG